MFIDIIPDIYAYVMICAVLAFAVYFVMNLKKENIPTWHLILSTIFIAVFALLGGRLMWALEVPDITLSQIFYLDFSGLRLLGAVVFALIAFAILFFVYKKFYDININKFLDVSLEGAFLAFAIAKFACFAGGCCYGIETTVPWGMVFPTDELGLTRHPTQLYETGALLLIFTVLLLVRNKLSTSKKYILALMLYVFTRMLIEPLRDEAALFIDGPTRIIYYFIIVICILVLFKDKILKLFNKNKDVQN